MKKRMVSVALIILIMASISTNAFARWNYISICRPALSFSGTTAYCTAYVEANSGSASITATAKLIQINASGSRTTIKTWSGLSGTEQLYFSGSYNVTGGLTYYFEITATVSTSQGSETVTTSASAKCP